MIDSNSKDPRAQRAARRAGLYSVRSLQARVGLVCLALAALGCADGLPGSSGAKGGEIVSIVGEPIPDSAPLEVVLEHPDAFERARRTAEILQRCEPEQLEDLKMIFANAALDQGDIEYALFGEWWARFDPESAFTYANHDLRMESPRVILSVVRAWASKDPLGAIESPRMRSQDLHMPALRGDLVDALVVGWFASGQPGLEDWIRSLPPGQSNMVTATKTYARLRALKYGFRETLEWTRDPGFPPVEARLLLAGALSVIAHQDPELAIEWLPIAEADGIDIRTFVPRIANAWGHHEPQKAIEWVLQHDDELERNRATLNVAKKWIRRDEQGIQRWLDMQGDEEWIDIMRVQVIRASIRQNNFRVDWTDLADRAQRIKDETMRQNLSIYLIQRWLVANPMEAEGWLLVHPDVLPADKLERARRSPGKDRERIEKALGMIPAT